MIQRFILLPIIIFLACSSSKLENTTENLTQEQIEIMKQKNFPSYPDLWEKVRQAEKNGLTKTAYKLVKEIYKIAKKDKNGPQIVKVLLYQSKYMMRLEENSQLNIIHNFEREINENSPPVKQILESYLAQLYWQYYQANRWKFAHRTETASVVDPKDFRTWDLNTLYKTVYTHFKRSLQNPEILKVIPVKVWKDILELSDEVTKYQPVLYDVLIHEALRFYENKENALTAPAQNFTIDKPEYLSDVEQFISLKINTKDTLSKQYQALLIHQKYLHFRLADKQHPDALDLADLQRLQFVYNNAVFPHKEKIYLKSLQNFVKKYESSGVSALAYFKMASLLNKLGDKYVPGQEDTYRWYKKQAVAVCETAIKKYPESKGTQSCQFLLSQIKHKKLEVKIERYIPENRAALIKIDFRNLSDAVLKIYKLTHKQMEQLRNIYDTEKKRHFVEKLVPVKTYVYNIPNEQDYQNHSTERIIDGLSNGEYVLLLTSKNNKAAGITNFQVTDIALQIISRPGNKTEFTVLNRLNGAPVINATLSIKKQSRYNGKWQTAKVLKTGNKGQAIYSQLNQYRYKIEVKYDGNKTAYFDEHISNVYIPKPNRHQNTAFLFTDRSIYRPGQTVYFKAICLRKFPNHSEVLSGIPVKITLYDVNRQKIGEKSLTTNDFGSINGTFILPEQTLTGSFNLEIHAANPGLFSSRQIRVEAYKRPKFEVKLNKPDKTYKVNDTIPVKGIAESFAGTKITNAKVTYRVKREVVMPRWWYWYRPEFNSQPQEIAHGTTVTGDKGEFVVKFKALPDRSVKPENDPVFHYKVYAEVTDLNGETHSQELTVKAGYKLLLLTLEMPGKIQKNKTDSIRVQSLNLNDVKVPAKVQVKIFKLQAPDRVLRSRPWPEPDIKYIDKQEFIKKLPHIPYDKTEADKLYWPVKKLYWEQSVKTGKQEKIAFTPGHDFPAGQYLAITTTKDKEGNEITAKHWFEIYENNQKQVVDYKYFDILTNKDTYQPGDIVVLKTGSASTGNRIRIWVEKDRKIILNRTFISDGTYKTHLVSVKEKDRGGFVIYYTFNAFNNYKTGKINIKVPYPPDQLEIETVRFRDKLKPGQQEEWRFKIKGPQSGKVAAEVLASMYDASLDQFVNHTWSFNPVDYKIYYPATIIKQATSFGTVSADVPWWINYPDYGTMSDIRYNRLKWFGFRFGSRYYVRGIYAMKGERSGKIIAENDVMAVEAEAPSPAEHLQAVVVATDEDTSQTSGEQKKEMATPAVRSDFRETAFFYPELYTDKQGNTGFKFTVPESLTKWKLQLLAHNKDLKHSYRELFAQTQKELMVFPNAPRFVRQGDTLIFSTKISNLSGKTLSGTAELTLTDAVSQKDVTGRITKNIKQSFSMDAGGNTQVYWQLIIPDDIDALVYVVKAKAGNQTDAEQNFIPVLSNRMLVTETIPMWVRSGQSKTFVLDKLLHPQSNTLKNHKVTLEITSNPAWYAVQALPYLMEYPYECSEQTFSRYYANTLAAHIVNQNPKIKQVFDVWKNYQSDALLSNLEKNQELKNILIEETPWLRDAKSESEQKKRIAFLFDLNKMAYMQQKALRKLEILQLPGGGFTWFKGGNYPNRYITQHIVAGFGHLKQLGVVDNQRLTKNMTQKALRYLDSEILKDFENLLKTANLQKDKQAYLDNYHPGAYQIHYLYARSFYPQQKMSKKVEEAVNYYRHQAQKYWLSYGLYEQGLLALISYRHNDREMAKKIIHSLDENSIRSEELGMYWKNNTGGWYWYQAPIETQALLIEAFDAIDGDVKKIDEMRIWLLKHKQTNAWKTTKQTTEAVYALLLRGTDFLAIDNNVKVKIGQTVIDPSKMPDIKTEAGTGYFKKLWPARKITSGMGKVTITKKGKGISWGALYWQYFEDLDKITNAKTPVAITKELFVRKFTDTGEILKKIDTGAKVKTGDLIRVRIEIKVDRPMEFVHLKDMRAAGFEPVNVLSRYKWQDGLGYYEATGDTATNFFIDFLPKGVYVFEYDLRANNAGNYSNGITQLQCMYAPEFSSHSKGVRVKIN